MTEEMRKEYALMRYGIIAPVVCHMLPEGKTKKVFSEFVFKSGDTIRIVCKSVIVN